MDTKNKIKSRDKFANQVAETIRNGHAKSSDAFIFGISGKWGEGKTEFLKKLNLIMKDNFEIIDINPWKFASDRISFLRYFILKMPKPKYSIFQRCRKLINNERDEDRMYYDVSSTAIHLGWFLFLFLILVFLILVLYINPNFFDFLANSKIKLIVTIVLIPIALAIALMMISAQKSSKSAETLDKFDNFLKERLDGYKGKKDILIFVDDLDRVSPKVARDVLDNLRTFFDNKKISFVVTGDHSVLERFLGNELLPDSTLPEQLEEGRRFLKKIFNVYWRLPLPIDSEVNVFLSELFNEKQESLNKIFKIAADLEIFKKYLSGYFDKNFRHIIRFLDSVVFTFDVINNLEFTESGDDTKYYDDLKNHPLLVVRILMIQELCAPLFELIINDFEILSDLEYAADKNENAGIISKLNNYKDKFTDSQRNFIEKFLFESPKFFKDTSLTVSDIRPFIYLAADAGFGDSRGPSANDFVAIFQSENAQQIKQALIASGNRKLKDGASKFVETLNSITDINKKNNLFSVILDVLIDLSEYKQINEIFFQEIYKASLEFIRQLPIEARSVLFKLFWSWLDGFESSLENYKSIFVYYNPDEIRGIDLKDEDKLGYFGSYIMSYWFVEYYKQNSNDALTIFTNKVGNLNVEAIRDAISEISSELPNALINDSNDEFRKMRFDLIYSYTGDENIQVLKDKINKEVLKLNHAIWGFLISKLQGVKGFEPDYFESAMMESVNNVAQNDFSALVRIFDYVSNKLKTNIKGFWDSVFKNNFKIFVDNIGSIIDSPSYSNIAPDTDNSEKIFTEIMARIKGFDDSSKINVLPYLNKQKWIWKNLNRVDKRKFKGLVESENETLKNIANQVISSWS